MNDIERVAVIGAGAAGLCTAKHLLHRGFDVTVLEMSAVLGGLWVYENENGRSPAYQSLHINSEARVTSFRDFPFPDGVPLYPSHVELREYLESYAEHFGLRRHIRFHADVISVAPVDGARAGWSVRLADGFEDVFDHVVVATGHQAVPAHPGFRSDFTGEYLHSHDYRLPEPFRGRRVLVVGVGNSALDIASDICAVTEHTAVSARSPVLLMPRTLWGVPIPRILSRLEKPWMPWPVVRRIRELLTRIAHGRMEQWGFTTPKVRTHPATHPSIMPDIMWGKISVRPGVDGVDGTKVEFSDGTSEQFDAIIAATGYEVDLHFLPEHVSPVVQRRVDLYRRIVSPSWPGLYFVGFFNLSGGAPIRMMDTQSRWLAALLGGDIKLPGRDEMLADIKRQNRRQTRLYPASPRYGLELDPREYGATMRADLAQAVPGKRRA